MTPNYVSYCSSETNSSVEMTISVVWSNETLSAG